jgi:hypothetical protein
MLGLPLTAMVLTTVLLVADGLALVPLVIVAVIVAYVCSALLAPMPKHTVEHSVQSPSAA